MAVFILTALSRGSAHEARTEAVLRTSTSSPPLRKPAVHAPYINVFSQTARVRTLFFWTRFSHSWIDQSRFWPLWESVAGKACARCVKNEYFHYLDRSLQSPGPSVCTPDKD